MPFFQAMSAWPKASNSGFETGSLAALYSGCHGETGCVFDDQRFGGAVGRVTFDADARPRFFDALAVQRIHQHFIGTEQRDERAALVEVHHMAVGELFLDGAIGRHAVVHAPGQVADFRVQGAAHGDIKFLKAPAHTQHRLAGINARTDQRQHDTIATPVEIAMRFGFRVAVLIGVHVGAATGEYKPVADRHDFIQVNAMG